MRVAINPKYRITSGGSYMDFDTPEEAMAYLKKMLEVYTYGSINKVYDFKEIEDTNE